MTAPQEIRGKKKKESPRPHRRPKRKQDSLSKSSEKGEGGQKTRGGQEGNHILISRKLLRLSSPTIEKVGVVSWRGGNWGGVMKKERDKVCPRQKKELSAFSCDGERKEGGGVVFAAGGKNAKQKEKLCERLWRARRKRGGI